MDVKEDEHFRNSHCSWTFCDPCLRDSNGDSGLNFYLFRTKSYLVKVGELKKLHFCFEMRHNLWFQMKKDTKVHLHDTLHTFITSVHAVSTHSLYLSLLACRR